jgi:N-acetylmuramoyl-L-alanine amidase
MIPDSPLATTLSPSPNFNDRRGKAIDILLLHYTGMASGARARARLLDPASNVSCHYLVWEDGRVEQMVGESDRAWHAGAAFWAGETDINSISIGIEIVNGGHDYGSPPYTSPQIDAVIALSHDICARHSIRPARVLGHSDVAPARKQDPGEWFPWQRLAAAGIGAWATLNDVESAGRSFDLAQLQTSLSAYGYDCPVSGVEDEKTRDVITAFHRHFLPTRLGEPANIDTLRTAEKLRRQTLDPIRPPLPDAPPAHHN